MRNVLHLTFSILCHNYGKYLKRAVDSCLAQVAPQVRTEVWVVDDGSTDETSKICAEYGGRIRVSRSENLGFGSTLTRAVQEASGDWIFFLDADDYFAPTKLAAFLPHFRNGVLFVNDLPCSVDEEGRLLAGAASVGGCTSTIAVFRAVALDLLPVENELYFHILLRAGKGVALKEAHTFYRVHSASMTNRHSPGVWNSYLASMTHRLANRLEAMSACAPKWLGSAEDAWTIAWDYRAQAWYNELEAALECQFFVRAWGRWFRMAFAAARGRVGLEFFHWKMLAKTILLKPSFPKSQSLK